MRSEGDANSGRVVTLVAAVVTLSAGVAVSAVPGTPWSIGFLLIAPAIPAAVLWRALGVGERLVLSGAVAVVVDAIVAEMMLATGTWSLRGGIAAVAVVSALMWVGTAASWDAMARGRVPAPLGPAEEPEREGSRSA